MSRPSIVIFTDEPGWHGHQLKQWFAQAGRRSEFVSLTDCHLELGVGGHGLSIPGFTSELPAGAFVRGVPGGTLEEVVLRLDILHLLADFGCPVFNTAQAIEKTVDKARTSALLQHRGLATPRTFVNENIAATRAYVLSALNQGRTLVKKPLFGSQGNGLQLIRAEVDIASILPGEVAYLQDFIAPAQALFSDCRVMVIDGRAVAAMRRTSAHWVTNRAQGASCEALALTDVLVESAESAAAAVGVDYAGVDLLMDKHGQWFVIEVNGIPAWQGLQRASGVDVTALLGAAFVQRLGQRAIAYSSS